MEVLKVVAESWPIAVMFIALCIASLVLYTINWFKRSNLDDKALRASQARSVQRTTHDDR